MMGLFHKYRKLLGRLGDNTRAVTVAVIGDAELLLIALGTCLLILQTTVQEG